MNSVILNDLVRTILQKPSLQECTVEDLQQVTKKFPYFSAGQLLFAEKLKQLSDPGFASQSQKLSLYFHDEIWLEQLLEQKGDMMVTAPVAAPVVSDVVPETTAETRAVEAVSPSPLIETIDPENSVSTDAVAPKNENMNAADLTFEPYHTVDYFASQGIKFTPDEQPKDKFGKQLLSFTEWLKTLKRLPAAEIVVTVDRASEQKVEQMAEYSLAEKEVVTEAMAEVWEKQGNHEKAIATYRKLSLLNPSKSSYFAAKIEQLKKS